MTRTFAVLLLLLHASLAIAAPADSLAGTYRAITAHEPDAESILKLADKGNGQYALDLYIVAPNRTHHGGHVEGMARRDGEMLTLTKQNITPDGKLDEVPTCVLQISVTARIATVLSDEGCAFYHGAAASFVEQGGKLVRD